MRRASARHFGPSDVGIGSFLGHHPGFQASFQRFSYDFLVREVDQEQRVLRLQRPQALKELLEAARQAPEEREGNDAKSDLFSLSSIYI